MLNVQPGQRYGVLTVLEPYGVNPRNCLQKWLCRCDCGELSTPTAENLLHGNSRSCGCRQGYWRKPNDPTPEEIQAACEAIQAEWPPGEARNRCMYDTEPWQPPRARYAAVT